MTRRPVILTYEQKLEPARIVARRLIEHGVFQPNELNDITKDIAKWAERHMDGYEIANRLERYAGWECDLDIAEILDHYPREEYEALIKIKKQWVLENPQDGLLLNTRVMTSKGTGTIISVHQEMYEYTVKLDTELEEFRGLIGMSGIVVAYEDVTPLHESGEPPMTDVVNEPVISPQT